MSPVSSVPLDTLRRQAEELQAAVARVEQASIQRDEYVRSLEQQIIDLKRALAEMERAGDLADELERTREEHEQLRQRIRSPRFWTDEFARPFAMDVQDLNALQRELAVDDPADLGVVFQRWQGDIVGGLLALSSGPHDEATAERLRRVLLVQWVYLQWLSVTHAAGQP